MHSELRSKIETEAFMAAQARVAAAQAAYERDRERLLPKLIRKEPVSHADSVEVLDRFIAGMVERRQRCPNLHDQNRLNQLLAARAVEKRLAQEEAQETTVGDLTRVLCGLRAAE